MYRTSTPDCTIHIIIKLTPDGIVETALAYIPREPILKVVQTKTFVYIIVRSRRLGGREAR